MSARLLQATGGLGTWMVDIRLEHCPKSYSPQNSPPLVIPLLQASCPLSATPKDVRSLSDSVVQDCTDTGRCIWVL